MTADGHIHLTCDKPQQPPGNNNTLDAIIASEWKLRLGQQACHDLSERYVVEGDRVRVSPRLVHPHTFRRTDSLADLNVQLNADVRARNAQSIWSFDRDGVTIFDVDENHLIRQGHFQWSCLFEVPPQNGGGQQVFRAPQILINELITKAMAQTSHENQQMFAVKKPPRDFSSFDAIVL